MIGISRQLEEPHQFFERFMSKYQADLLKARGMTFNSPEEQKMRNPDDILSERQQTHGDFGLNAAISQDTKRLWEGYKEGELTPVQAEALDMIALKVSRILSGQAYFADHWNDIAGYARLAAKEAEERAARLREPINNA